MDLKGMNRLKRGREDWERERDGEEGEGGLKEGDVKREGTQIYQVEGGCLSELPRQTARRQTTQCSSLLLLATRRQESSVCDLYVNV